MQYRRGAIPAASSHPVYNRAFPPCIISQTS